MWQISPSDALAGVLFLVASLVFFITWAWQRRKTRPLSRASEASLAADALMHASAETGKRLSLYTGEALLWPNPALAGATSLPLQSLAAKRAIFNDHAAQSLGGDATLALLALMVTQGFYEKAVAPELFRLQSTAWAGPGPWASMAGFVPELDSPANSAVLLSGAFGPASLLAMDLAARQTLPALAAPASLSGQLPAFASADLYSLGEDAFQLSLPQEAAARASLEVQDALRLIIALGLLLAAALKLAGVLP